MKRNVPKLRFKGFDDEWKEKSLGELFDFKNGLNKEKEFFGKGTPIVNYVDVYKKSELTSKNILGLVEVNEKEKQNYSAKKGDVFFTRTSETINEIGYAAVVTGDVKDTVFSGFVLRARPKVNYLDKYFCKYCFATHSARKEIITKSSYTTRALTSGTLLSGMNIFMPTTLQEQEKIANFLTKVDSLIEEQDGKVKDLELYKKGMMQKVFSQEIRFKDDNGCEYPEWEEKKLSEYLFENKEKNKSEKLKKEDVLSVSGECGIVNQIEHLGRSYAGVSVANYGVVKNGDIVYTKSPLKNNPYGIIKANRGKSGIVSTLYAIYSCKDNVLSNFIHYYFELDDHTNKYVRPLVHKGAKNDMKINNEYFLTGLFSSPSLKEQEKIVRLFINIDNVIEEEKNKLEDLRQWKKGLLQQMFV